MQVNLNATGLIPKAGGRVQVDKGTGEIRLTATGLPDIETFNLNNSNEQGIYQAWFQMGEGSNPQKLGILTKTLDRTYFLNALVGRQTADVITRLAVTVEPEKGIVLPSENLIYTAELKEKI